MEGDTKEGSREGLSRLLMEVLGEEEEEKDIHQDNELARKSKVELREEVGCMEQAFSALCNGLVELSSMPKYQQEEDPDQEKADSDELPMWLLGLLVCCKLEEGDEASIRIQVPQVNYILKQTHVVFLAHSNSHFTGTGCASTICDCNPKQRKRRP